MEKFADYGFNKSHSAAYAKITYQTGYLKGNFTTIFMAVLLSEEIHNADKISSLIRECCALKIKMCLPDINSSHYFFSMDKNKILYGLGAIKGITTLAVEDIAQARDKDGAFKSLHDFWLRVDSEKVSKKIFEYLTYSGTMDSLQKNRRLIIDNMSHIMKRAEQEKYAIANKQVNLLKIKQPNLEKDRNTAIFTWKDKKKLAYEKSTMGFTLSDYFMTEEDFWLSKFNVSKFPDNDAHGSKKKVVLGGVINRVIRKKISDDKIVCILQMNDGIKQFITIVESDYLEANKEKLIINNTVIINGYTQSSKYKKNYSICAENIILIKEYVDHHMQGLVITIGIKEIKKIDSIITEAKNDDSKRKILMIKVILNNLSIKMIIKNIRMSIYDFVSFFSLKERYQKIEIIK